MPRGVIQLQVLGEQNRPLCGNTEIIFKSTHGKTKTSFFRSVFRQRINFAKESIEIPIHGKDDFGHKIHVDLEDYGDLVHSCGIQLTLPQVPYATGAAWVDQIGHMVIKKAYFQIGKQKIDTHYGHWLSIWNELTLPAEKEITYHNLIGNTSDLVGTSLGLITTGQPIPEKEIFVPLQFWFNRNPSLAFPLITLQAKKIKPRIYIEFEKIENLIRGDPINIQNLHLGRSCFFADYIYLSKPERLWFVRNSFDVIIDQLQVHEVNGVGRNQKVELNDFNHPLIEMIWTVQNYAYPNATDITKSLIRVTDTNCVNPVKDAVLLINNNERFKVRNGRYFNKLQTLQHHQRGVCSSGINVYSFAEKPEQLYEYTGSLNVTGVDELTLNLTLTDAASVVENRIVVYARNFNILTFHNGTASLKYVI